MSNAGTNFTDANMPSRSFGSDHDSVLDGITRGLEALFPPLYQIVSRDEDPEPVQDDHEA